MRSSIKSMSICVLLALSACEGTREELAPFGQIEGYWTQEDAPTAHYWFSDGRMLSQVIDFGLVLSEREYCYRAEADTVFLQDLLTGDTGKWVVSFKTERRADVVKTGAFHVSFTINKK